MLQTQIPNGVKEGDSRIDSRVQPNLRDFCKAMVKPGGFVHPR
jgi:hypothetical protein